MSQTGASDLSIQSHFMVVRTGTFLYDPGHSEDFHTAGILFLNTF